MLVCVLLSIKLLSHAVGPGSSELCLCGLHYAGELNMHRFMGDRSGHNAPSLARQVFVCAQTLQLAVRVIKRQTWRGKFVALYVAHAQGRVGQKDVNNSGAKPGSAMLCWLVVRFVAVITVINQFFLCMDICE